MYNIYKWPRVNHTFQAIHITLFGINLQNKVKNFVCVCVCVMKQKVIKKLENPCKSALGTSTVIRSYRLLQCKL
jgi:hypothetical protein